MITAPADPHTPTSPEPGAPFPCPKGFRFKEARCESVLLGVGPDDVLQYAPSAEITVTFIRVLDDKPA